MPAVSPSALSIGRQIEGSLEKAMAQDEFGSHNTDEKQIACGRAATVLREAGADATIDTFEKLPALLR